MRMKYVLLAKAIEDSVEISEDEVNMVLEQQINELLKQFSSLEEAEKLNMRCPKCRGSIKRGVRDRIEMLSDGALLGLITESQSGKHSILGPLPGKWEGLDAADDHIRFACL